MDIPYRGRFSAEQIDPVLKAASPIQPGRVPWHDHETGQTLDVLRGEAIVRDLEFIDKWVVRKGLKKGLQPRDELSPSTLAERFHAIAAAAKDLLAAFDMKGKPSLDALPRQIRNALGRIAERDGARFGQLRNDIEGIGRIQSLARQAKKLALGRSRRKVKSARPKVKSARLFDTIGMERWTDDTINDVMPGILRIWTEILGQGNGRAVDSMSGKAYGPLNDFSRACLKALNLVGHGGKPLGPNAVDHRIRVARGRIRAARGI